MFGMGSMYSLEQNDGQLLTKSLKPESGEDNGVNLVFWEHKPCILRIVVPVPEHPERNLKIQDLKRQNTKFLLFTSKRFEKKIGEASLEIKVVATQRRTHG